MNNLTTFVITLNDKRMDWNKKCINEWRKLGFYYDWDDRISVNQLRFFGSKNGLHKLVEWLDSYTNDEDLYGISEHDHMGPYMLKIMTWDKPTITNEYIAGTTQDLKNLKNIIANKLNKYSIGQTFNVDKEYGTDNTITLKFFIMADDFDPASMDESLIIS